MAEVGFVLNSSSDTTFPTALDAGLPANIDAEKTILGAILLDNASHAEVAEVLKSDDFSLDSHRRIYLRMSELINTAAPSILSRLN